MFTHSFLFVLLPCLLFVLFDFHDRPLVSLLFGFPCMFPCLPPSFFPLFPCPLPPSISFVPLLVRLCLLLLVPLLVPSGCSLVGFPCFVPRLSSVLFACLFFVDWWNSLQFSVRVCSYISALFWTNSSMMNASFDMCSPSHTVKFFSHVWFLG